MAIETKVVGLDVAKNVFQVHGVDRRGETVVRKRLRRSQVAEFFRQPSRDVTISTVISVATSPEVGDNAPSTLGRRTKRRKERPMIPTSTATAHMATKAPYQVCSSVACSSPTMPKNMCFALTHAKARNPHRTMA